MNTNTKEDLIKFIDAVESLGLAVATVSGIEAYSDFVVAGEKLKASLETDDTILESR